MRRIDKALRSVNKNHRQENYTGPLASTSAGGHNASVNNLYNSQVRDANTVMPYGISSRPFSGIKAQTVVNDNSDSVVVGVYDPSRPKVGVGEVCLYSAGGCSVYLSATGVVSVTSGNSSLDVSKNMIGISSGNAQVQIKNGDVTIKSGDTSIKINSSGGITIDTEKSIEVKSVEDITLETKGKVGITTVGDISVKTEGTTSIESTGDMMIKSNGTINMESAGDINMKCSNLVVNDETMIVP